MRPDDRRRHTIPARHPVRRPTTAPGHLTGTGWSAGDPTACRYASASYDSELHRALFGATDSETASLTGVAGLQSEQPPSLAVSMLEPLHTQG
jgi:hypothetical protein